MTKIMNPIDVISRQITRDNFVTLEQQFFYTCDTKVTEKLNELLKDSIGLLGQVMLQSVRHDTVVSSLQEIAHKLYDFKRFVKNYFELVQIAIEEGYHYHGEVKWFGIVDSLIPIAISLINQVTKDNFAENTQVQVLQGAINEVLEVINKQSIDLTQVDVSELIQMVDEVGKEGNGDSIVLDVIKATIKHIVTNEDPIHLLDYLTSSLDLLTSLQIITDTNIYSNREKIDCINYCIENNYIDNNHDNMLLQLGCELLRLGDVQGALKVLNYKDFAGEKELTSKFYFNKALALFGTSDQGNLLQAESLLKGLLQQIEIVDTNKVQSLLVATLDKLGKYEEAIEIWDQIDIDHQPDTKYEELLLLKYKYQNILNYKDTEDLKKEIVNKVYEIIQDKEIVDNLTELQQDIDFCYLIGVSCASQHDFRANEYFNKFIELFDQGLPSILVNNKYCSELREDLVSLEDEANIFELARIGDITRIKEMLDQEESLINAIDEYGLTPLYYATSAKENILAVILLLKRGVDPAIQDNLGYTALHNAANENNVPALECILNRRPDLINIKTKEGWTALDCAVSTESNDAVSKLLEFNPDCENSMHRAAYVGNIDAIKLLLDHGEDINTPDSNEQNCLHHLYQGIFDEYSNDFPLVQELTNLGVNKDAIDVQGRLPHDILKEDHMDYSESDWTF